MTFFAELAALLLGMRRTWVSVGELTLLLEGERGVASGASTPKILDLR